MKPQRKPARSPRPRNGGDFTPPLTFTLSASEAADLNGLNTSAQPASKFWRRAIASRGIAIPATKVYRITPLPTAGSYRLSFERKALGPQAIAAAAEFNRREAARQSGRTWERNQ